MSTGSNVPLYTRPEVPKWVPVRTWIHDEHQAEARRDDLLELIRDQAKGLNSDHAQKVRCPGCDRVLPVTRCYRCFQCDLWLCPACSRLHFGVSAERRRARLAMKQDRAPDGIAHVRDVDNPCAYYEPGTPQGDFRGDGHHLCKECGHRESEAGDGPA